MTRVSSHAYAKVIATSDNDGEMFRGIVHPSKLVVIENGVNGYIADEQDFIQTVVQIMQNRYQLLDAAKAARRFALENSWDAIFEKTYKFYRQGMTFSKNIRAVGSAGC